MSCHPMAEVLVYFVGFLKARAVRPPGFGAERQVNKSAACATRALALSSRAGAATATTAVVPRQTSSRMCLISS